MGSLYFPKILIKKFYEPNWLLITAAKVNHVRGGSALPGSKPLRQFRQFLILHPKAGGSSGRVSKEHSSFWALKWLCSTLLFCSSFLSGVKSQHSQLSTQFNATVQQKICDYWLWESSNTLHQVRPSEQRRPAPPVPFAARARPNPHVEVPPWLSPQAAAWFNPLPRCTHISASTAHKTWQAREKKDVSGWQHSPINHCFKRRLVWKSITQDNPKEKLREKQKRDKTSNK